MSLNMFERVGAVLSQTQQATTDNSGGVAATTIAEITEASTAGSADTAPVANAIASLAARIAEVKADVDAIMDALNKANGG